MKLMSKRRSMYAAVSEGRNSSGRTVRARVPKRSTRAERFVVAAKSGNADGAKESRYLRFV